MCVCIYQYERADAYKLAMSRESQYGMPFSYRTPYTGTFTHLVRTQGQFSVASQPTVMFMDGRRKPGKAM